ncbi:hypothetical protein LMTR13_12630 [Bradyrhizobium icense]|uniref:Uncharacterized protein n=1 Tax=Bradyrhizobium icense TaxID=1274631 RepID=A0A1B1UDR5_9BRAD|nr:hypothetical protein LMTR13_12630 [Bradyrhizobium icense]
MAVIDGTEGTCVATGTHEASGAVAIATDMHLQDGAVTAPARGIGEGAAASRSDQHGSALRQEGAVCR